jgi:hypothetical protein
MESILFEKSIPSAGIDPADEFKSIVCRMNVPTLSLDHDLLCHDD